MARQKWMRILEVLYDAHANGPLHALPSEEVAKQLGVSWNSIWDEVTFLEGKEYLVLKDRQVGIRIDYKLYLAQEGIDLVETRRQEIIDQLNLLAVYRRRLTYQISQRALQGQAAPFSLIEDIRTAREDIRRIKVSLRRWEVTIEDQADDEETAPPLEPLRTLLSPNRVPLDELRADFVIMTALEEERDTVLEKLPGYHKHTPSTIDIRVYYSANLPTTYPDGSTDTYRIVVMPLLGMGRVQAATATGDAIRRWQPRYVILVGIAGGIAAKNVCLGDILISDQIVDYELQKLNPRGPQVRWEVHRADPRLVGAARNLNNSDWQTSIMVKRPGDGVPKRHIGPIASGDKVIAFSKILAKYRDKWPALIGVEMEAAGVAMASFQAANSPGFFMVRGVSDFADEAKGSAHVEQWRQYACDVAASYVIALLQSGPIPPSSF